ncbi:MAG: MBL fold metallo-hydrolase [Acidimicrobiaceae bacterium]|nr:MBL fold metallo-hydrolase [Acidimicrobiaceae bacterium]MBQ91280.1 MBL fold metallo-hydrolase [Acidimicrobiaceae bacterium]|tara:strand:+ start:432 stop:1193 length:762 start_codon:yes stop_codon:yes gene_type:complete
MNDGSGSDGGAPGAVPGDDRLYFRQLLSGRDFGHRNQLAQQMVNFVYLIGDRQTGEAVVVDPAYDVAGLLGILEADGMRCAGVLATHYHPDHVGGSMMGFDIAGAKELLEEVSVPVHAQREEAEFIRKVTGLGEGDVVEHASGDRVRVGEVDIELIHTPGHTPGSQCFLVDGRLVAGDTLFLEGCGRTDLPGGDPAALYQSLTQRLARVPDEAVLYPGHLYSPQPSATMGHTRSTNFVFMPRSEEQWLAMFGR